MEHIGSCVDVHPVGIIRDVCWWSRWHGNIVRAKAGDRLFVPVQVARWLLHENHAYNLGES